ncbi:hypothetical protein PHJA_002138500 [Phtheirospermum japonicum]|uniref:Uncharacterized protein n=1 Tax=Phtheirospermum japonicum TaxID=374723 RepID=A0A830CUS0_9LAMI|nr:hypothetical protein PHJA_002138500 [Phtheirospermum japonicum]
MVKAARRPHQFLLGVLGRNARYLVRESSPCSADKTWRHGAGVVKGFDSLGGSTRPGGIRLCLVRLKLLECRGIDAANYGLDCEHGMLGEFHGNGNGFDCGG